ncbi:MAG: hypothetical protein EBV30_10760 [Actinobacteria bacterium]|nr:hypothetical protein [Actinomycetota bacterium]NBO55979.1 hypothetical protein [Actinomycetota bacterium]
MLGKNPAHLDHFGLKGRVEIWAYRNGELFDHQDVHNIILYTGNAEIIRTLSVVSPTTQPRIINRMCIGDQGTIPADPTVPKVPTKNLTSLFHEIYRKDVDSRELSVNSGVDGSVNQCRFVAQFNAVDVAMSAYANPSQPRVNEVGLVFVNPVSENGLIRTPVTSPDVPPSDEVVLSIRCFKSIPFEVANDVTVTIRYTLYME